MHRLRQSLLSSYLSLPRRLSRRLATQTTSPAAAAKIEKLRDFLSTKKKYDAEECDGIINTLKKSGLPVNVSTARSMGDNGLAALVESLHAQQTSTKGREEITIHVNVPHERHRFSVQCYKDDTIQDVAERDETVQGYLAFACTGNMACSTCHCVVDEESFQLLEKASTAEEDMLDMAADLKPTSRLGCQIKLFEGLEITIPERFVDYFT